MNLVNHAKPVHLATQVIIDSGCSRHVVGDNFSKYFTSRTNIKPVMLRLPDGKTYTSNEKVSMTLRVKSTQGTKTLKLSDVILVPSLNQCLMSVHLATKIATSQNFAKNNCVRAIFSLRPFLLKSPNFANHNKKRLVLFYFFEFSLTFSFIRLIS